LLDDERQMGGAAVDAAEMGGVQLEHRDRVARRLHPGRYLAAAHRQRIDVAADGVVDGRLQVGALEQGQAYVQFCLFGGDNVYTASQRFAEVK
jgi:hypothetical protein